MKFIKLDLKKKREYRAWARANYKVNYPIDGRWHPVVQQECVNMNEEAAVYVMDETEAQEKGGAG